MVLGDVTRPDTLPGAVDGVDAVVFTLGSDGAGKVGAESVDYGGVRNVLGALGSRTARIALMTSIGVTNRTGAYNRATEAHDWKRRSERLVRASGLPYTIVRPGWFDYNAPDERQLVLLQGDTRQAGDSQRWRHCAAPDRRSPGPQPRLGSRIAAGGVAGISFNSALSRLPSWMLTGKPRSSTGFSAVPTIMLHSRSSSPFRKAQNGSTDDIFSRSLGLCTSTICGPNEIICMPGCFRRSRCTPARRAW